MGPCNKLCLGMSELNFNVQSNKIVMWKIRYQHNKNPCIRIHSMKELELQLLVFGEQVLVGAFHPP